MVNKEGNPNIKYARKTGPITKDGKDRVRYNSLKSGQYAKDLVLSCGVCKLRKTCEFFEEKSKCKLRGNLMKDAMKSNLDTVEEMKELITKTKIDLQVAQMFDTNDKLLLAKELRQQIAELHRMSYGVKSSIQISDSDFLKELFGESDEK